MSRKARTCFVDRMRCAWVSGLTESGVGWDRWRKVEGETGGYTLAILQKGQADELETMMKMKAVEDERMEEEV